MTSIKRIYVEKKQPFDVEAQHLLVDLPENLGFTGLHAVRVLNRYDIAGINEAEYQAARTTIFSEPPVDHVYDETFPHKTTDHIFAIEYLPGQYDQRADSAAQCIQIITRQNKPVIVAARLIILSGPLSQDDLLKIKRYLINPVDSREASLEKPLSLQLDVTLPETVEHLQGFTGFTTPQMETFRQTRQLAMSLADLLCCQDYFKNQEHRDPSITEIKMLDTYWSDHCRHTTFETLIQQVAFADSPLNEPVRHAFEKYLAAYQSLYPERNPREYLTLMNMATMSMKEMSHLGLLPDLEVSGEINACSIIRDVDVDGTNEEWLVMFKNETHNHPTEIEPFGGAATCLGGAIRDPLSGRAFVYQAMRVTGSGNPLQKIAATLPGKLPQRKITTEAAHGYSSYGNQIGLPTGQVTEIYHDGYIAKRMEVGAVLGAVPRHYVLREEPVPGDVVVLVGGRTGRDGIGGATGSSKEHDEHSITTAGAEVQKGNAPEERKIQRLFRNPAAIGLIKKCNDFGAGGVSVAIGELADGLEIFLDVVPKKYEGLDGTELALSESQERMAVVTSGENAGKFKALADNENLEATVIATVTAQPRLKMFWHGATIVDISREFISSNGVRQRTDVFVTAPHEEGHYFQTIPAVVAQHLAEKDLNRAMLANLAQLNVCGQRGLIERFDSTVGGGTVSMPLGGKFLSTPIEAMAAKIPVFPGSTSTASLMSFGFNPLISSWSPFHGAVYAVVEAVVKIIAAGGDYRRIRTSLQEYFEKPGSDPRRWGKPFSALLGAYYALTQLGIAAIGGKDSMSGSFKELDVPPTLITFAVDTLHAGRVLSPEFKFCGSVVVYLKQELDESYMPRFDMIKKYGQCLVQLNADGKILAARTVRHGGIAAALAEMCFGNQIGFTLTASLEPVDLFTPEYGSFLLELDKNEDLPLLFTDIPYQVLGYTQAEPVLEINPGSTKTATQISIASLLHAWESPLEPVFPTRVPETSRNPEPENTLFSIRSQVTPALKVARPRVLIPIFPGTNCEYETQIAFEQVGAIVETFVFRNLTPAHIDQSLQQLRQKINNAQIIAMPGGFSAGDEPDGSGKFIAAVFRNPSIKDSVMALLQQRDGLILGVCNGFQVLVKLGLLPYGEIRPMDETSPNLTLNQIGRHINRLVRTRVTSVLSPWFLCHQPGDIHLIPVSHGEGRFIATPEMVQHLTRTGQVATQYVDMAGRATHDIVYNPNGSMAAIEGITSPDGRVLGKMGHTERITPYVATNVPGDRTQRLFESGVLYFQ